MKKKIFNYIIALSSLSIVFFISFYSKDIWHSIEKSHEHAILGVFFLTAIMFMLSSLVYHVANLVKLPSFVVAIFLGILAKPFLEPIISNQGSLSVLVGLGATLILFGGGLETPFHNFKKLIFKIFSLSFPGLLITAFLTSLSIYTIGNMMGLGLSILVAVLLGAVLASTDPAAIIPILKRLKFKNRSVKDIVISESAFTDVTGTLLTLVFLSIIAKGIFFDNILSWYYSVFSLESGIVILKQLFFGILLGLVGYGLLEILSQLKKKGNHGHEADLPFFLFVPIVIFVFALIFEGSGYLAAFIAGLLFNLTEHLKDTEHFFNNLVEGFLKPTIFILLGGLVDITKLLEYAPIGILIALIFMFIIRPITVFISLSLFRFFGKERLSLNDLLFISFVRETGAIPAVLLVTIASLGLPQIEGLLEIGMWVILATLIIAPPLTPKVAQKLKVAKIMTDEKKLELPTSPEVMIVSRGFGFTKRLPLVVDYAYHQNINKVSLLLCLEEKYSPELENKIKQVAFESFRKENKRLKREGKKEITFRFISREGLLEDNIDFISMQENSFVTTIFAGKKILDYHLDEIKQLSIPIRFVD
ncbi:MAG: cation:proton antiporter [Candidatus Pacebacteria bacterium]|nr:cation:proton antiporter [Candidatus Paceibacterota bacterium]